MKKQWKTVLGYEGIYEISNYGEIKSLNSKFKIDIDIIKKVISMFNKNVPVGVIHKKFQIHRGHLYYIKSNPGKFLYREKLLKPRRHSKYGHLTVNLYKNKKWKTHYVHRLVLEAFVGQCPPGMECRHLDGNTYNNKINNLKWGTRLENMCDSIKHQTRYRPYGPKSPNFKLNKKDLATIKNSLLPVKVLAKRYGVHITSIYRAKKREIKW